MWHHGRIPSTTSTVPAAMLALVLAAAACSSPGSSPPPAGIRPDGFPTGVFSKLFVDPFMGPMRLSWVFEPDGDWAEVPEATAGQTIPTGPARGRYVVDGELVTLEVDHPSAWGWSRHRWRLDGDRLVTTYESSELPEDAGWFAMLDAQPWVRVP
ncbi:MAG TPA: hypothetical protein VGQ02_02115 [Candidatus Limnocylindrales bacterium]|nr:hypothetical protein [Candidatus Limnocylindrales bacterium]